MGAVCRDATANHLLLAVSVGGQRFPDRRRRFASEAAMPSNLAVLSHNNFGGKHFDFQIFNRLVGAVSIGPRDAIVFDERIT